MTPPKEQSELGAALLPGEERRRSQRVIIRVPVTLEVVLQKQTVIVSAHTVAVNIHGAMLLSPRTFGAGTTLEILNDRSRDHTTVRITRAARESAEGFLIPVEFISPSPTFWQISFPPQNWKPSDA